MKRLEQPGRLGTGIGWRPEIADAVEAMPGIDWVEAVAENLCPGHLPESLLRLRERGVTVVPHGVSLGLGGADRPAEDRLAALAERAGALGSPLVTEHIAFVRAGGALTASPLLEAGHLLPVPRTRDALDVLCENVRIAQAALPVPLAVENIAALIAWPGEELTEGQFLYELADRTGVRLLIDVANLHTNHVNRGEDPTKALAELPVEAIAYVHVAGGFERDGVWHDSHAHPVPDTVLDILTTLASRATPPGVLLERDDNFPEAEELERELESIRGALARAASTQVRASETAESETSADEARATATATPEAPATSQAPTSQAQASAAVSPEAPTAPKTAESKASAAAQAPAREARASAPDGPETAQTRETPASETSATSPAPTSQARASATASPEVSAAAVPESAPSKAPTASQAPAGQAQASVAAPPEAPTVPETAESKAPAAAQAPTGQAQASMPVPPEAPAASETPVASRASAGEVTDSHDFAPGDSSASAPESARQRVALAQAALLSALVAGTPVPEGFDRVRLGVQARALGAKRADVVAKVAPELPEILGAGYRPAFLAYAHGHPMAGGYRHDALDFAAHLLLGGQPEDAEARRRLREWWLDRSGPAPRSQRPTARLARATRRVLLRR
ncbi:DUF692 family multinuclear iron-containing protein [Streptomyces sp. NPDC002680]|uniref:multinuclear nonheme iron-dependent oxidase n=1 Tax=Streptomyces sp. NPDC002680 TaxID=3364659 RepID=UPI003699771A